MELGRSLCASPPSRPDPRPTGRSGQDQRDSWGLEPLRHVVLEGRVVTMDALLTQRSIAQQIVDAGGDYVMMVKENQPRLHEDIPHRLCARVRGRREPHGGGDGGLCHGRIEQRRLPTSDVLVGHSDWPGLSQVFQVERHVILKTTGAVREEVGAGGHQSTPRGRRRTTVAGADTGPMVDRAPIPLGTGCDL